MSNKSLNHAIKMKYDEFYTQYEDIDKEIFHYQEYFHDKIVYCNCDNMYRSNFPKFFILNFNKLKLKELIVSGLDSESIYSITDVPDKFDGMEPSCFDFNTFIVYMQKLYSQQELFEKELDISEETYPIRDFRSSLCTKILEKCDIVCTNPPFSLFRDFVALMVQYHKKFLIIGNKNALTYKTIFPLIKNNQVWLGCNSVKKFLQPDGTFKTFGNVGWYTNIPVTKQNDIITLSEHYYDENGNPLPDVAERFPKFDNYDAINIGKLKDIPMDYFGVMGVPITILDKYNPSICVKTDNFVSNYCKEVKSNEYNDKNVTVNFTLSDGGQQITDFFTLSEQPSLKAKDLVVDYGKEILPNPLFTEIEFIREFLLNGEFDKKQQKILEIQRNLTASSVYTGEGILPEAVKSIEVTESKGCLSGQVGQLFKIVGVINHGCDHEWDLCKCTIGGKEIFKRIAIQRR